MSIRKFNTLKSQFYNSLKPCACVQYKIDTFLEKERLDECLGVHIRRTDRSDITPDTAMFATAINRKLSKTPGLSIFLCTDSASEISNINKLTKANIITYPKKTFDRYSVECIQDALVEWKLLSMCDNVIYSQSSSYGYESCIPNKLSDSVELRKTRHRTDNETRNLPRLIFEE